VSACLLVSASVRGFVRACILGVWLWGRLPHSVFVRGWFHARSHVRDERLPRHGDQVLVAVMYWGLVYQADKVRSRRVRPCAHERARTRIGASRCVAVQRGEEC
jgi:hypothetical protein